MREAACEPNSVRARLSGEGWPFLRHLTSFSHQALTCSLVLMRGYDRLGKATGRNHCIPLKTIKMKSCSFLSYFS